MSTLNAFKKFLADEAAWDMFVTGAAGTGKTTDLASSVQHCIDMDIPYVVCAFTHKACGILRSKLPANATVRTLHSFLKKCPSINQDATSKNHLNVTIKTGDVEGKPKVMFLDEYSMVGEKDVMDIVEIQDSNYDAIPEMKVVWLGDKHQLPPVGDQAGIKPKGNHQVVLTKQYRNDNPLQQPLNALISYMDGSAQPAALKPVEDFFERNLDIVEEYCENPDPDKVILAYTNYNVQQHNCAVAGSDTPVPSDRVFSPSTQHHYEFVSNISKEQLSYIDLHYSDPLCLGSKYKTLENLRDSDLCYFGEFQDDDGDLKTFGYIFGHYNYKVAREQLEKAAVACNKEIEDTYRGYKAAGWARANPTHTLARARAKAWRDCLSFKDCVICVDFPYAMTVHKSQGSTYKHVYLDMQDIAKVQDFDMQLKLLYVGISRASNYVGTN